jgi:hypothetical protein
MKGDGGIFNTDISNSYKNFWLSGFSILPKVQTLRKEYRGLVANFVYTAVNKLKI